MKTILAVLAVVGVSLFFVAISLFNLHDGTVFTSPPETVVENFTEALVTHRYSQALKFLDKDLQSRTAIDDLKRITTDLELRVGKVRSVRGESVVITNSDAQAMAVLKCTRTRFHTASFGLSRRSGSWRIDSMNF
jgi:hypothetical protein